MDRSRRRRRVDGGRSAGSWQRLAQPADRERPAAGARLAVTEEQPPARGSELVPVGRRGVGIRRWLHPRPRPARRLPFIEAVRRHVESLPGEEPGRVDGPRDPIVSWCWRIISRERIGGPWQAAREVGEVAIGIRRDGSGR